MATTPVSPGAGNSPDNNDTVTSGNTLDVQSGGAANNTTVQSGGTLEVDAGGSETNAVIQSGGLETDNGSSSGDMDFGIINLNAASGVATSTATINAATVESGGALNLNLKGALATNTTVLSGGALTINGNAAANGTTLQGGTLELISPKADTANPSGTSATGTLTFASGSSSRLQLDVAQTGTGGTTFAQTITGFAPGDVIDLVNIANGTVTTTADAANPSNTDVKITGTNGVSETFVFVGAAPAGLTTAADPGTAPTVNKAGGTDLIVTCYVSGTQIRTVRGDVPVEHLAIGDRVVTSSGAHRPIRWLGHRTVECRRHPRPHETMPVRITAHAFGDNRPARDLFVSPGHAICIDLLGEVLIPAVALVNGTTIQQIEVDETTYWHIELDSHDVILAENLAAESYLDMGNRGFFAEGDVVTLDASPDADSALRTHADFCRPFYAAGPMVEVVQAQLRKLGKTSGWALTHDLELHLDVDGHRFDPIVRDLTARFHVPAGAKDVWLVSPTARPSETMGTRDDRDLGLFVAALRIEDGLSAPRDLAVDDPLLCVGFHAVEEGSRRWTSGRARLPAALWEGCENGFYLRIDLACSSLPRWHRPADARPALALVG